MQQVGEIGEQEKAFFRLVKVPQLAEGVGSHVQSILQIGAQLLASGQFADFVENFLTLRPAIYICLPKFL